MKSKIAAMLAVITMAINIVNAQHPNISPDLIPAKQIIEALATSNGYNQACEEEAWRLMPPIKSKSTITGSLIDVLNYCCRNKLLNYSISDSVIRIATTPLGDSVLNGYYILIYVLDREGNPLNEVEFDINGKVKRRCLLSDKGMLLLPGLREGDIIIFYPSINTEEETFRFSGAPVQLIRFRPKISELATVNVSPNGFQDIEIDHVTGANKVVQDEQFAQSIETDIIDRLRYSAPAYLHSLSHIPGGYPYTGTTRGINTIEGNMGLLFVLDNMPLRNLEAINPNNIASITIANDAATMALYGSRAANGVVIMTSRKSRSSILQISFTSTFTHIPAPSSFGSMGIHSKDFVELQQELFAAGAYDQKISNKESLPYVIEALDNHRKGFLSEDSLNYIIAQAKQQDIKKDLNKYLYQPGYTQQSFLHLAQSFKDFQLYASAGNDRTIHNIRGSYHNRTTAHVSGNWYRMDNLSLSVSINFADINGRRNPYRLPTAIPYLQLADENGNPLPIPASHPNSLEDTMADGRKLDLRERPVQEWQLANDKYKQSYFSINPRLTWQLRPWLEFNFLYNHGTNNYNETIIHDKESFLVRSELSQHDQVNNGVLTFDIPQGDIYNSFITKMHFNDARYQVNIRTKGPKNKFITIAGVETQSIKTSISSNRIYGYGTAQKEPALQNTTIDSIDFYTGIYLNSIYSIKGKIIFSGSLRKDQMNRYGPKPLLEGRPFYSLGTAVHIHKLDTIFKQWPSITLRTTIGESGNDNRTLLVNTTIKNADPNYHDDPVSDIENYANTKLGPERVRLINAGVELTTRDNIFQFGFDYFWKKSNSLWGWKQLNPNSGARYIKSNNNSLKGHGFDFYMQANYGYPNLKLHSFFWLSHTINTITTPQISLDKVYKYGDLEYYRPQQFHPVNAFYAFRYAGLNSQGHPLGFLDGVPSKDYDKIINNKNPSTIKYIGSAIPRYYGSITQSMMIRKFIELSFQVSCQLGYYYKRPSLLSDDLIEGTAAHSDYYLRWQRQGDEQRTNIPSLSAVNNKARDIFYENSEAVIHPADHIRIEFLRVGLLFDNTRIRMLKKGTLSCYMTLHNLNPIWTKNRYREDPAFAQNPYIPGARISLSTQINF